VWQGRDRGTGGVRLRPAPQAIGAVHGDCPHDMVAHVFLDFQHQGAFSLPWDFNSIIDFRELTGGKFDIHHTT
jgi:hypothetical protein